MRRLTTALLAVVVLTLTGMSPNRSTQAVAQEENTVAATRVIASGPAFPVFDATLYLDKPDLEQLHGLPKLRTHGRLWPRGADDSEPDRTRIVAALSRIPRNDLFFMDIEHWPVNGDPADVQDTIRKYNLVTRWIREARPDLTFGYYGIPPVRDYWRAIKPRDSRQYQAWAAENDALQPMIRDVDVIYPSLYTFYDDPEGWVKYAEVNIREARKYGKPVYPFLWPQYHDSHKELKYHFIDGDFWRIQLETCLKHADGVVIWGGWTDPEGNRLKWDPTIPWWRATLATMAENGERLVNPNAEVR
ncbi:hypothetical protein [Mucisphaera calidilacus]|uniref:Hyaluronidase n=1 Tax=Mucisphaera calidilacus TaxID=2527982 RepID=A0A518C0I2_9BACT|nr:hypothetical protein [Mucisphaera calidilacus]QDU72719.1 hypothetical protein Pan265_25930 [Mucisphaera calidilacus]